MGEIETGGGEFVTWIIKCGWICSHFVVGGINYFWRWVKLWLWPTTWVKIINLTPRLWNWRARRPSGLPSPNLYWASSLFAHHVVNSKTWIHVTVKGIHVTAKAMWQQRRDTYERMRVLSHMTWRLLYIDMTYGACTFVTWLMHDTRCIHMRNMTHAQRQ